MRINKEEDNWVEKEREELCGQKRDRKWRHRLATMVTHWYCTGLAAVYQVALESQRQLLMLSLQFAMLIGVPGFPSPHLPFYSNVSISTRNCIARLGEAQPNRCETHFNGQADILRDEENDPVYSRRSNDLLSQQNLPM